MEGVRILKKIKKIVGMVLLVFLLQTNVTYGAAAVVTQGTAYQKEADFLNSLGLFQGTEAGYELERVPNRTEAAVMLLRLLGKENSAKNHSSTGAFDDVPIWAEPYISYMYDNGLTQGVAERTFGATMPCDSKMYLTFVLRALGYDDTKGDFTYDNSIAFARMQNLINSDYVLRLSSSTFVRGDLAAISFWALFTEQKNNEQILLDKLIFENALSSENAKKYSNIYHTEQSLNLGYLNNVKNGTLNQAYVEKISIAAEGYPAQHFSLERQVKGVNIMRDPKVEIQETYISPDGKAVLKRYVVEGYRYTLLPDGKKIKEKISDEDDSDEENASLEDQFLAIFSKYKSTSISKNGDKTNIKYSMPEEKAQEDAVDFLESFYSDFSDLKASDYVIIVKKNEYSYTLNKGFLENREELLEFDYMVLEENVKYSVSLTTSTKYNNTDEVNITIPDLSSYKEQ